MSIQLARNAEQNTLGQSQQNTHGLLIYVLVIVSGFLLLVVLDGVFSHLISTLDERMDNERQRLRIGEVVLLDLKVLEADIYKMAITYNPRGQYLIQGDIVERLTQLEKALDVLEQGGTLDRVTRINIESQDSMRQRFTYQKEPNEVFLLEVIDLRPKLARIRERTVELGEIMATHDTPQTNTDHTNNTQYVNAIKTYLRAVPPEFIRMNENAARLLFIGKQKTEELEQMIQQRTWLYQLIEGLFSALIIVVFSLFAYQFNRKLQATNKHLQRTSVDLLAAKQAAETANRAKSAFLANMSHELRTPLNAILGFAQILQQDPSLDATHRQDVDIIKRSGDYLLTLINDVLDLAKIEAGRLDLVPGHCDIDGFFRELANLFHMRTKGKGVVFQYESIGPLPYYIEIDEKRLRQICMNLLNNAVKFTEQGEVRLEVNYRTNDSKDDQLYGELIILVSDSGIGIATDEQEAIFEPFQQVGENEYKQQGTGLGLPITRSLVKQMGGHITLESEKGQGSRFTVQIPVPELEAINFITQKTEEIVAIGYRRTDGVQGPLRILEADDVSVNRSLVRGLLEPLGFEVTEVANGAEAVAITEQQVFDMILMDLVMPKMDGLTATRQILARSSKVNRHIIALTAHAFDENRIECLEAGCCEHLSKPLDKKKLLQMLQTFLPLEWEYPSEQIQTTVNREALLPNEPSTLPKETLETLENAIIRGALEEIDSLLEPIKAQDAKLGATLQGWLAQYEYQKILDWIEVNKDAQFPVPAASSLSLSTEILVALEDAIIRGALDEVDSFLKPIKDQDAKLGATLQGWLEQYEYQKILDWIEGMKK